MLLRILWIAVIIFSLIVIQSKMQLDDEAYILESKTRFIDI